MFAILLIIAPVFGIIAIGYAPGKSGYLAPASARGIADFAFNITIPALLFRTILLARFEGVAPLGIFASFFGAAAIVWVASAALTRFALGRPAADGPAVAMCAVFGNSIMLGLPIGVATLGPEALAPISVIIAVHAPIFLLAATLHTSAVAGRTGETLTASLVGIARQLARQPIIVAIAVAGLWRVIGLEVPGLVLVMVETLAKAGVPAALVALGLSLTTFAVKGDTLVLGVMLALKMVVMPIVAGALAFGAFRLPLLSAEAVMLMAALPAGANAYLFSVKSGRCVNAASGAVAVGTALSALTLAALIALFRGAF
jgi:predicted permease